MSMTEHRHRRSGGPPVAAVDPAVPDPQVADETGTYERTVVWWVAVAGVWTGALGLNEGPCAEPWTFAYEVLLPPLRMIFFALFTWVFCLHRVTADEDAVVTRFLGGLWRRRINRCEVVSYHAIVRPVMRLGPLRRWLQPSRGDMDVRPWEWVEFAMRDGSTRRVQTDKAEELVAFLRRTERRPVPNGKRADGTDSGNGGTGSDLRP